MGSVQWATGQARVNEPSSRAAEYVLRLRAPRFASDVDDLTKVDIEPRLRELATEYGLDPDETVQIAYEILSREQRRHR